MPIEFVELNLTATNIYLPGTYESRLFHPGVRFTRTESFLSSGEGPDQIEFDTPGDLVGPIIASYSVHEAFARIPDLQPINAPVADWVTERTDSLMTVDGHPTTVTTFTADCEDVSALGTGVCSFNIEGWERWVHIHGYRIAVVVVDLPDGIFTIVVEAPAPAFDTYWAEVAQPILDSIEFLDQ